MLAVDHFLQRAASPRGPSEPLRPEAFRRDPRVLERCPCELWEDVACALPVGHCGSHHRPATPEGAALSWRSSASR